MANLTKTVKRRAKKPQSESSATSSTAARAGASQNPPLSPTKLWLFRLAAFFLLPLLFLVLVEIALRVAGYGYSTRLLKPVRIGETECLVENDKFGLRFFPPSLARSPPPIKLKRHKTPGAYRIFILGESAALGDPRPAYGPGRYLQALLQQRFPETEFEIVCTAITAINSHAILPIARECAGLEPDCWLIYMGNNEMVGPFGAATVFGAQAPPRFFVRLALAAQKLRLGQLVAAWTQKLRHSPPGGWGGMEMFVHNRLAWNDPRKDSVHRNFDANLEDLLRVTLRTRAPVFLNSVAVNLKDCPPFASDASTNLSASSIGSFSNFYAQGTGAAAATNFEAAANAFAEAARIQPHFADVQFLLGQSLLALGNPAAVDHFQLACDDDALPFRATSILNGLITKAAARHPNTSLTFMDAAALFASNSPAPAHVPGQESFYEHVHFNFDGNYLLGRAWAEFVARSLPAAVAQKQSGQWASQADCENQLALTDWNRASVLEDMLLRLQQPPFSGQLNHTQRLASLRESLAQLHHRMDTNAAAAALTVYQRAIARHPADHRLHENFAEFLEGTGNLAGAAGEWTQVTSLLPHHHLGYFQTGRLLALQGKNTEAKSNLLAALQLRPDLAEGWLELGKVHAAETNHAVALEEFEKARLLLPQDARIYYQMGKSLSKLGNRPQAIVRFAQAVKLRPNSWQARYALGEELAFNGQNEEALKQFEEVVRLRPDYSTARLNLGVALYKLGRTTEAKAEFTEAVRLNPRNRAAQDYLKQLEKTPLHFP